jgi:predicted FMN-binding regulatory protein PaiB
MGEIILTSHFSKSNNHSKKIQFEEILVIFTEPHAYISPKLYDKKKMSQLGIMFLYTHTEQPNC